MLSSSIERRKGSGAASGGTSTNANAILYCYRIYRSPYIIVVIVLAFAITMYLALMHDDITKASVDQIEAIDQIMMAAAEKKATYKYEDTVSKTIVDEKKTNLSIQQSTLDHLKTLKDFPKIIHLIWSDKDILSKDYEIIEHGAKKLQSLNPDWLFIVHDYKDIDDMMSRYGVPTDAHIVEKTDAFRLLKIYEQGGIYVDIDRVMNVNLNEVIDVKQVKLILATYYDINFTNDLFGSSPGNKIIIDAFKKQQHKRKGFKRRQGWITSLDQMELVRTYTSSIETALFGRRIGAASSPDNSADEHSIWDEARRIISEDSNGMIVTSKDMWCDGLLVEDYEGCKDISRDSLYDAYNVQDWNDQVDGVWNS